MNKKYIAIAAVIAALFIICSPASAETGTYAKGDTVTISGTATGSPQQGLAVWVFGPNYWTRETQTLSGDKYNYEILGSVTDNLAAGQYFCIVQHPMYNGVFDADLNYGTTSSDQISVKSTAGQSFIIDGSGKLQGSSAAHALMNMLDSPDIDDTYTVTEFFISEPWIRFTPEETYYTGDMLLISGQTNIAAGERLIYELYSASFVPTSKSISSGFSGESGYTEVIPAYPDNNWEVLADTTGMKPDVYMFKISREDGTAAYSAEFTLVEGTAPVNEIASQTPVITESPVSEETGIPAENVPLSTPAAGTGVIIVLLSIVSVFVILGQKRF